MIQGTWFDSFAYDGGDPETEIDSDVCNGTVYSNEDLIEIIKDLERLAMAAKNTKTKKFLLEIAEKAQFGVEIWE